MYVMQVSTHSPCDCPHVNDKTKKATADVIQKVAALTAKHGVKLVEGWHDVGAHTVYNIYETPDLDAYWAMLAEPDLVGWLQFNTVENRVVQSREESWAALGIG